MVSAMIFRQTNPLTRFCLLQPNRMVRKFNNRSSTEETSQASDGTLPLGDTTSTDAYSRPASPTMGPVVTTPEVAQTFTVDTTPLPGPSGYPTFEEASAVAAATYPTAAQYGQNRRRKRKASTPRSDSPALSLVVPEQLRMVVQAPVGVANNPAAQGDISLEQHLDNNRDVAVEPMSDAYAEQTATDALREETTLLRTEMSALTQALMAHTQAIMAHTRALNNWTRPAPPPPPPAARRATHPRPDLRDTLHRPRDRPQARARRHQRQQSAPT